jgi:hypothetical protein
VAVAVLQHPDLKHPELIHEGVGVHSHGQVHHRVHVRGTATTTVTALWGFLLLGSLLEVCQ